MAAREAARWAALEARNVCLEEQNERLRRRVGRFRFPRKFRRALKGFRTVDASGRQLWVQWVRQEVVLDGEPSANAEEWEDDAGEWDDAMAARAEEEMRQASGPLGLRQTG